MGPYHKHFLVLIAVTLLSMAAQAQSQTSYFTADEFSQVNCEEFLARADQFFNYLRAQPTGKGFMIIKGDKSFLRRKLAYENWWYGAIAFREFDGSRVRVIRAEESGNLQVRYMILPSGVDQPPELPAKWDLVLGPATKPFLYHDDMEQICSSPNFAQAYTEYLDANPNARGHVVVYANSKRMYQRGLSEAKRQIANIPTQRLKYFYKHQDTQYPWAEYWVVPRKKK